MQYEHLPPPLPLIEHLCELRQRILYCFIMWALCFIGCYAFSQDIFTFCVQPLATLLKTEESSRRLIYTGLTEAFTTYLKLSLFVSFFMVFPAIAYQVWRFVAPALYKHEKRFFLWLVFLTPLLLLAGASMAYYVVCPWAFKFFLSFEMHASTTHLALQLEARISEYLSLLMKLMLAFGVSFQLPILMMLLVKGHWLQLSTLQKNRKYAFLGIVVVAALVTPPDIISPISLSLPLYGLYEFSIVLIWWQTKKSQNKLQPHPKA